MAVFHSTGKDENFQMLTGEQLAMGGKPGKYLRSVTSESWLNNNEPFLIENGVTPTHQN